MQTRDLIPVAITFLLVQFSNAVANVISANNQIRQNWRNFLPMPNVFNQKSVA